MHDEIAHIIPTYERPAVAQRLVNSIRREYGDAPNIYVCDDSRYPVEYDNCENIRSPAYDIGLSAKRNILVQNTEEPYVFLWDDDYICTPDTSIEKFFQLIEELDDVGIVGGNWMLSEHRNNWFVGWLRNRGTIRVHEPPSGRPISASLEIGTVRYHRVQFLPNWFLADRETLQACPWDETLKLQEHVEFFARLAALRAPYSGNKLDEEWRDRYNRRADGDVGVVVDDKGRVEVFALTTFQNKNYFPDRDRGIVKSGEWVKIEKEYAEELRGKGYVSTVVEMKDGRPFYIPDIDSSVPLGVVLLVDTTCMHDRRGIGTSEYYNQQRYDRSWRHLQFQKMGNSEVKMRQWHSYPYGEFEFDFDESLLTLPEQYQNHEKD
jgi:glycosyltransferase involved in cell wall biosynthesis